MKTFKNFVESFDWGYGLKSGDSVKIHEPGHPNHGKEGKIIRQNSINYGVEVPHEPGKLSWHNFGNLKRLNK